MSLHYLWFYSLWSLKTYLIYHFFFIQESDNLSNTVLNLTNSSANSLIDLEKEKLKQDLIKQTEMSNKLETLCLQYRQVNKRLLN